MQCSETAFDAFMYPLERLVLAGLRRKLIPRAHGRVLEVGAGTGANLPHYRWEQVRRLHMLDLEIADTLRRRSAPIDLVELHEGSAEELPFEDGSFDSVVFTLVFCSVEDPLRGLAEVKRVLRPGGNAVFIEHVRPSGSPGLARFIDMVNPAWHALSGSCNLNRDTLSSIESVGLQLSAPSVRGNGFLVSGVARST